MRIAISSGHGRYIRGARGEPVPPQLDEVDEARRVVDRVWELLEDVGCVKFHDNVSTTQSENLDRIVNWHNQQDRTLDVSVHFNAYDHSAHGTEVLYVTQDDLAAEVSAAICAASGFTNRGAKYRSDLAFLNGTEEPAILIETCFCDHTGDSILYREHFEAICNAIASSITGITIGEPPERPERPERPPEGELFSASGPCSWFGGPDDTGVSSDEGLAFLYDTNDAPHLFLPSQPTGTSGLARRLNPNLFYVACRWDYNVTPKSMLADPMRQALVSANGKSFFAWPADWGPHQDTGRVADLSPALIEALELETDDHVQITYPADPWPKDIA
jgi:hypothetical protein